MRLWRISMFLVGLMAIGILPAYSQREIPKGLVITLERSACFGHCPIYSLSITTDGVVKFIPLGQPAYRGKGEEPTPPLIGKISANQIRLLLAEFQRIKFHSLRKRYGSAGKSSDGRCPEYWTDNPTAKVSILENGRHKRVSHYLGCRGAQILNDLEDLEYKIDEIANTEQWTSQFGWGAASVIDLQLKVNRANPPTPQKPR